MTIRARKYPLEKIFDDTTVYYANTLANKVTETCELQLSDDFLKRVKHDFLPKQQGAA